MDDRAIDEMSAFEDHHWWFVGKRLLIAALLGDRLARPGQRILDVGCGTGGVLAHLSARVTTVGVDRSVQALHHSSRRGVAAVACADMDRLPFGPERFDLVLMLDVLEHFEDDEAVVRNVRPLLRAGGALLVSVPAFQALFSEHDVALHHPTPHLHERRRAAPRRAGARAPAAARHPPERRHRLPRARALGEPPLDRRLPARGRRAPRAAAPAPRAQHRRRG